MTLLGEFLDEMYILWSKVLEVLYGMIRSTQLVTCRVLHVCVLLQ